MKENIYTDAVDPEEWDKAMREAGRKLCHEDGEWLSWRTHSTARPSEALLPGMHTQDYNALGCVATATGLEDTVTLTTGVPFGMVEGLPKTATA